MTREQRDEFEQALLKAMTEPIDETNDGYGWRCLGRVVRHPSGDDGRT